MTRTGPPGDPSGSTPEGILESPTRRMSATAAPSPPAPPVEQAGGPPAPRGSGSSSGDRSLPPAPGAKRSRVERLLAGPLNPRHLGIFIVVGLSGVLNVHRIAQNGYANIFYSAGDRSMLRSLHNFLFVSFDAGGLVSVDKPPVALWVQTASAKLFGFSPLSLLVPEALAGVLAVAVLYVILARRLGAAAALAGALALAVFPSFVAVSRENGVDSVLILLLVMACGAGLRAIETGRWRTMLWCGALVGLAFNTKTLAAYLVVPGIALGYLVCAPDPILRRCLKLLAGGLAMVVVSFAWIAYVDSTPASQRPYVGSSTNNSELGLAIEYNGVGRVGGQNGGPGQVAILPGARVPFPHRLFAPAPRRVSAKPRAAAGGSASTGRERNPIPFGGSPGPLRLFGKGLGDQGAWMLPFAFFGLLALAALAVLDRRRGRSDGHEQEPAATGSAAQGRAGERPATTRATGRDPRLAGGRRDPRLASALVLGGWFLVEAIVLSSSKGIVHPYYISALAPGTGAMAGAGALAFVKLAGGERRWRLTAAALVALGVAATVAVQVVLLHREHYMVWFAPVLVVGGAVGIGAVIALRRLAAPAVALMFGLLLVAPTAYSASTWLAPVEGTFPAAGPKAAAGTGGVGVKGADLAIYRALVLYAESHRPGTRWSLLTVASDTAAPMILLGSHAGALGGYSGTDPAIDGSGLARAVASREARYVVLGGEYSTRGGNRATWAVLHTCKQLQPRTWDSPVPFPFGLSLFDCAGRERALARYSGGP